jgi:hypothetical protein
VWLGGLGLAGILVAIAFVREAGAESRWCHRVGAGESLTSLASRYGTGVKALAALNGLRPGTRLAVGRRLLIPTVDELRRGTLLLSPRSLQAQRAHLRRENAAADRLRLSRMRDLRMVRRFVRAGLLVPVPREAAAFSVDGVPASLRVARPWTRRFIEQLAAAAHVLFDARLRVTSLTRTESVQRAIGRSNGNAAPARGPRRSSHLTGASVDIATRPHTGPEILWLRTVLGRLARSGVVLAIEEVVQPHFHVMVFPAYTAYARSVRAPVALGGC